MKNLMSTVGKSASVIVTLTVMLCVCESACGSTNKEAFHAPTITHKKTLSNSTILLTNSIEVSAVFLDQETKELFDQHPGSQIAPVKKRISVWFESTNLSWEARQVISADLEYIYSMCSTARVFALEREDTFLNPKHLKVSHGLRFIPEVRQISPWIIGARYQEGQFELVVNRELVDKYVEQMDLVKAHEPAYRKFQDFRVKFSSRDFLTTLANGSSADAKHHMESEQTMSADYDFADLFRRMCLQYVRMPSLLSFYCKEYRGRRELFCDAVMELDRRVVPWPCIYLDGDWRLFIPIML